MSTFLQPFPNVAGLVICVVVSVNPTKHRCHVCKGRPGEHADRCPARPAGDCPECGGPQGKHARRCPSQDAVVWRTMEAAVRSGTLPGDGQSTSLSRKETDG